MLVFGTGVATAQTVQQDSGKTRPAMINPYDKQAVAAADPQEMAGYLTMLMVNKLSLTAEQATKVKAINAARMGELQALWLKGQALPNKDALKQLVQQYSAELKTVISPEQFARYEAYLARYKN